MTRQLLTPIAIFLAVVAFVAGSIFVALRFFDGAPSPASDLPPAERPQSPTLAEPPPPPPAPVELPVLAESDDFVRLLVEELSDHPQLAEWLVPEDLVQRFVAAVDNVARGEDPRPHLQFLDPGRGFLVSLHDGRQVMDAASYQRYDLVTEVFSSLDTAALVRLYRDLYPLLEEAYRDLGYPEGDFDAILNQAMERILAAPVLTGAVEVEQRVSSYRFQSPELERLGPVEKQLLRMGPANTRKIQAKLHLIKTNLALTRPQTPPAPPD